MPGLTDFTDRYGFKPTSIAQFDNSERAWRVESSEGVHVLRLHGDQHQPNHAAEIAALRHLEAVDFPAPRLITAVNGDSITCWGDRSGYLTTFIDGRQLQLSQLEAGDVGGALAALHNLDIDTAGLPGTTFTVDAKRRYFDAMDADPEVRAWDGYAMIRQELTTAWSGLPDFRDVPHTLIHTDVLFHNVIRTPAGGLVFIDWEGCGVGPAIQDIGYFLGYAIPSEGARFGTDMTRAFLQGYVSVRPLMDMEWQRLTDAILFGSIFTVLWYSMVYEKSWLRTRYVLQNRTQITSALAHVRATLSV
jgi:Ser/Thr protein kinase RdoA (MazF antagonist)